MSAFFVGLWGWLAQAPFHEDEAIYAAWALDIARGDWLVWQIPVDKPPLTFYPLAAVIATGARAEWLVRIPTFLWGMLALWRVGQLAERLGRNGWVARGAVLASPLWWAMWASAFTDMAAVTLGVWGIGEWIGGGGKQKAESENGVRQRTKRHEAHRERQGIVAGVLMGLAVLAKPTMVLWLPLVLTSSFRSDAKRKTATHPPTPSKEGENGDTHQSSVDSPVPLRRGGTETHPPTLSKEGENGDTHQAHVSSPVPLGRGRTETHPPTPSKEGKNDNRNGLSLLPIDKWRGWIEGFAGVLLLAWAWDASRVAPSWWRLGAEAYGTLGRGWGDWVAWGWLVVGTLGMSVGYGMLVRERGKEKGETRKEGLYQRLVSAFRFPLSVFNGMILLWIPIHVLLGFQPWERYLLPLVVLVAVQLAPNHTEKTKTADNSPLSPRFSSFSFLLSPFSLLLIIAPFLVTPLQFAPQDGRWNGIREVGAVIQALPPGSEVWYGAIGRPLAWYGAETNAELIWAGVAWRAFPGCAPRRYIATRQDEPFPTGLELIAENGDFGVWMCKKP